MSAEKPGDKDAPPAYNEASGPSQQGLELQQQPQQYPAPQGQYAPPQQQPGQYPPQGGYAPPEGQYPPPGQQQPGQYPPPQQGQYAPPPQGQYPAPQPGQYPAQQPGQYPAQQPGQYSPAPQQGPNVDYVPASQQPTVIVHQVVTGNGLHKGFSSQPFTYVNAQSPQYPKSTDLFTKMSAQFGSNNVEPPPDWITDDKQRVRWLKSDHNALIYFLYRKPKYTQKMGELVNGGCCAYKPLSKYGDNYKPCELAYQQTCGCFFGCCAWCEADNLWYQLVPEERGGGTCCFAPCREGGIKQRQKVLKRLRQMGVPNVPEQSNGKIACCLLFCNPCIVTQTHNVMQYYRNKRYGPELSYSGLSNWRSTIRNQSPQYERYMRDCKEQTGHPYHSHNNIRMVKKQVSNGYRNGRRQTRTVLVPVETVNTRENVATDVINAYMPWGWEYTKPEKAIEHHNSMWSNVAVLSNVPLPPPGTGTQVVPPVTM